MCNILCSYENDSLVYLLLLRTGCLLIQITTDRNSCRSSFVSIVGPLSRKDDTVVHIIHTSDVATSFIIYLNRIFFEQLEYTSYC